MVGMSVLFLFVLFFFKQKTAYDMRISDWSSDVCSSDLNGSLQRRRKDPFRHIPLPRLCLTLTSSLRRKGAGCKKISCRGRRGFWFKIGRASCRERVCQYV